MFWEGRLRDIITTGGAGLLQDQGALDETSNCDFIRERSASYKVARNALSQETELAQTGTAKVRTADLRKLAAEKLVSGS